MAMPRPDRHLDLGCGAAPRNPYRRGELCGVDIQDLQLHGIDYRMANVVLQPIPFPDDHFASASAFDFLEHVPRIFPTHDFRSTRFPFVELMDELWRVLAPDGLLYAVTPAFPAPEAFLDPTHVNFITEHTHLYFCGAPPEARMYGFKGRFESRRVCWVYGDQTHDADAVTHAASTRDAPLPIRHGGTKGLSRRYRAWTRRLRGKPDNPAAIRPRTHVLWELQAIKP